MAEEVDNQLLIEPSAQLMGHRLGDRVDVEAVLAEAESRLVETVKTDEGLWREVEIAADTTLYLLDTELVGIQTEGPVVFDGLSLIGASTNDVLAALGGGWSEEVLDYDDVRCRCHASADGLLQVMSDDTGVTSVGIFSPSE